MVLQKDSVMHWIHKKAKNKNTFIPSQHLKKFINHQMCTCKTHDTPGMSDSIISNCTEGQMIYL